MRAIELRAPVKMAYQLAPEVKLIGALSRAEKQRAFNMIEHVRRKFERPIKRNFKTIFKKQMDEILKLEEPDPFNTLEVVNSTNRAMESTLVSAYTKIADEMFPLVASKDVVKSTYREMEKKGNDSFYQLIIQDWIRNNAGAKIRFINDSTLLSIREIMENSESMLDFRDNIQHIFEGDIIPNRAATISRTETSAATNRASLETVKSLDSAREQDKVWQAVNDEDVRDSHLHLNGRRVGINDRFEWVGKSGRAIMDCPCDNTYAAPAGEIINCRCWIAFY